jgi:hypothetical protein
MIVYNKKELKNTILSEEARSLKEAGFIDSKQYERISKELITLKGHNNLLIRLAFFILGAILYSSISGFLSLIMRPFIAENYKVLLFLYAIIGFLGAEFLTRKKFYGHGLDRSFYRRKRNSNCLHCNVNCMQQLYPLFTSLHGTTILFGTNSCGNLRNVRIGCHRKNNFAFCNDAICASTLFC